MKRIHIGDKEFELSIPEKEILSAVNKVSQLIQRDYADKNPLFVIVLNGAFVFAADLLRTLDISYQFTFTKFSSYEGTSSTGAITEQLPIGEDLAGRHVIIIEDIIDTGYSMQYLLKQVHNQHPASLEICALSFKPSNCKVKDLSVKYIGMNLPDAFIVGYGLDYNQQGRGLRDIYTLVKE